MSTLVDFHVVAAYFAPRRRARSRARTVACWLTLPPPSLRAVTLRLTLGAQTSLIASRE
jgi:hypothetical protein